MTYESPWERLTEAVLRYAEAEEEEAYRRERDNLRKSAIAYGVHVMLRHDTQVRVVVRRLRPHPAPPDQLRLWPVKVRGIDVEAVATCWARTA